MRNKYFETLLIFSACIFSAELGTGKGSAHDNSPAYLPDTISIQYGKDRIEMAETSYHFDIQAQKSLSTYSGKKFPDLKIGLLAEVSYIHSSKVVKYEIEISSAGKLEEDLFVSFPVVPLENFDHILMPLKNGTIGERDRLSDRKIASYRCAGISEKYASDLAIPVVIAKNGEKGTAIYTDPYFTSLFETGAIRWCYPKKVGLEDKIERRTIILVDGVDNMDSGMDFFYETILKEVSPGPGWAKDIAMISYDYMSDKCRGWYNDIDTLTKITTPEDRHKIALCLHGWYDIVGRYCFDEKTGKLDKKWNNRITKMNLSLEDLHDRISYAKKRGYRVLMYFADGVLSSKGLPDFKQEYILEEGGWNGPDVLGGPYHRNIASKRQADFFRNYAKALFTEFEPEVDGFVWDETFYIKAGNLGTDKFPGYLDRIQMRLIKELTSMLHNFGPDKAFFTSDCIGPSWSIDVPPYALVSDGTYQDSHSNPHFWSYGIFPNYRNTLWSCNWDPIKFFAFTVFGVYAYNTPVVFTNGWSEDKGFSEMTQEEKSDFIQLFDYRKQFRTKLKALHVLPLYYGPEKK